MYRTADYPPGDPRNQFPHIREGFPFWPTYKTVHPNCAHSAHMWIWEQKSDEERQAALARADEPFNHDPRGEKERLRYEAAQRANRERLRDRKQWERYQEVLGKDNVPKTLSAFRAMKKSGNENWEEMQGEYKSIMAKYAEQEKSAKRASSTYVDEKFIKSAQYKKRFEGITSNSDVDAVLHRKAVDMLLHRNTTSFEDMHLIDGVTGKVIASQTHSTEPLTVDYNDAMNKAIKTYDAKRLIAIHNHPNSYPPSGSDLSSCYNRGYMCGIVACHDGRVYVYQTGEKVISAGLFDALVDKFQNSSYYLKAVEAGESVLEQFAKDYEVKWEVRQ